MSTNNKNSTAPNHHNARSLGPLFNLPVQMTEYEKDIEAELKAEPWMLDALEANPDIRCLGPHFDEMMNVSNPYSSQVIGETWAEFRYKQLKHWVEVVNFRFTIRREAVECGHCDQSGYNEATNQLADQFFATEHWRKDLTDDELEALWREHRLRDNIKLGKYCVEEAKCPSIAELRKRLTSRSNCDVCLRTVLEARARRHGIFGKCKVCGGPGIVFTEEKARLFLTPWVLISLRECSRGVEVEIATPAELAEAYAYLRHAADRSAARFSAVPR